MIQSGKSSLQRSVANVKRTLTLALLLALLVTGAAASVQSNEYLEVALTMLEEGNLFLYQYNFLGDNLIGHRLPLGMPYFFAGVNENAALRVRVCVQESSYYKPGRQYLYGLDCKGFTRWVQREVGVEEHAPLSDLLYQCRNDQLLEGRPAVEWPTFFEPGDLLVVDHGPNHVLMYIGTPEEYGLTAENAPEIAAYLNYPLFIHCGYNPFYHDRYKDYIKEKGYRSCLPPDGGVTVSIVGMEEAPHSRVDFHRDFTYFMVWDQPLPIFSLKECSRMAWIPHQDP